MYIPFFINFMFDTIFWYILDGFTALLLLSICGGTVYYYYTKFMKNYYNTKRIKYNTIPIVHKDEQSILNFVLADGKSIINTTTHMDFLKTYEILDKDKDIYIVMHTKGGSLSSAEAITKCILNHTGKGKIICVIPYYAYSAGYCIALCCYKIVMHKNAIVGPCDAQHTMGSLNTHSIASIVYAVDHKKKNNEKIDEKWLACSYDAELCKTRQRKYMDTLVKFNKYNVETADKIYDEFFSGKYNHDQVFGPDDLANFGVNVEVVDNIDENVRTFL